MGFPSVICLLIFHRKTGLHEEKPPSPVAYFPPLSTCFPPASFVTPLFFQRPLTRRRRYTVSFREKKTRISQSSPEDLGSCPPNLSPRSLSRGGDVDEHSKRGQALPKSQAGMEQKTAQLAQVRRMPFRAQTRPHRIDVFAVQRRKRHQAGTSIARSFVRAINLGR